MEEGEEGVAGEKTETGALRTDEEGKAVGEEEGAGEKEEA